MVRQQRTSGTKEARPAKPRYTAPRRVCAFCAGKANIIDYKEADRLRSQISDRGKIEPRRRTGTCAKHQRLVATAVKRARHLALLPYVPSHIRRIGVVAPRS